jgi:hypothetical protein
MHTEWLIWAAPVKFFTLVAHILPLMSRLHSRFNVNPGSSLSHSFQRCWLHTIGRRFPHSSISASVYDRLNMQFKSILLPIPQWNRINDPEETIWPFPITIVGSYLRPHTLMLPLPSKVMSCGRVIQVNLLSHAFKIPITQASAGLRLAQIHAIFKSPSHYGKLPHPPVYID